jgi:hypothetical protein
MEVVGRPSEKSAIRHIYNQVERREERGAYHVSRAAGGLDDEPLCIELPERVPDDLPHALQRLEVVLRLVVLLHQPAVLLPLLLQPALRANRPP